MDASDCGTIGAESSYLLPSAKYQETYLNGLEEDKLKAIRIMLNL